MVKESTETTTKVIELVSLRARHGPLHLHPITLSEERRLKTHLVKTLKEVLGNIVPLGLNDFFQLM